MKTISYVSLGCKVNLYECEAVINQFVDNGFVHVKYGEESDVCLINTCSITANGDAKSRKAIRQTIRLNPQAIIVVMGCYSQLQTEVVQKIRGVDIVIGTSNRDKIYDLVTEKIANCNKSQICLHDDILKTTEYEELKLNVINDRIRGFVKIQDGCDNYCSYCTIPYARGHIRSRNKDNIISEIQSLSNQGIKEIVLTGINTASYGKDLQDYSFSKLLQEIINSTPNLGCIRISSIEATEISDSLIAVIKENLPHFCHHLHIPLQGGSDNTLKAMNRKYKVSEYAAKIATIRKHLPQFNITTDVMVGFNGETCEDFISSYDFIQQMQFGELHVFPYSRRPLTRAYNDSNIVSEQTKKERVLKLLSLNKTLALNYRKQYLWQEVTVLIEKEQNGYLYGHTSDYLEVMFKGHSPINSYAKVLIQEINYPISKGEEI